MISSEGQEAKKAGPLDEVHAGDLRLWLEEVDEQAPKKVEGHEEPEERTFGVRALAKPMEKSSESAEEQDFVRLGGVPGNAVPEVDGPRQRGWRSAGVVGQASQETPDTADCDAEAKGKGKQVACAYRDAFALLCYLHGEPTA